jgi:hypothetical protein
MEKATASIGYLIVDGWIIPLAQQPLSTIVAEAASFR